MVVLPTVELTYALDACHAFLEWPAGAKREFSSPAASITPVSDPLTPISIPSRPATGYAPALDIWGARAQDLSHRLERGAAAMAEQNGTPTGEAGHAESEDLLAELDLGDVTVAPTRSGFFSSYVRDLTPADLAAYAARPVGTQLRPLARIHASHHAVARCLAIGMKPHQTALVTGYTTVRINQLEQDPAFQTLLADYRAETSEAFAKLSERMYNLSLDAIEALHERFLEEPQGFSVPVLLDIVKTFADRTGHGPNSEVTLNVNQGDTIDRPPRETFEQWQARRNIELAPPTGEARHADNPSTGAARHAGGEAPHPEGAAPDGQTQKGRAH
jgi:hypothetical protein